MLVTKTGQDGHRTGKGCLQNRYSDRYRDRQSDIELLNTCVPLSSLFTCYTYMSSVVYVPRNLKISLRIFGIVVRSRDHLRGLKIVRLGL